MTDDIWTVKRILDWIEGYLAQHDDENPRLSSQWLVSEALGVSRMQLFVDAERPLTADERAVLRDWTRRRGAGEPLQYITGEVAFRHITVKVRQGVLIPRPETEVLVSEALALLPAAPKPQDALDEELARQFAKLQESDAVERESFGGELATDSAPEMVPDAPVPAASAGQGSLLKTDSSEQAQQRLEIGLLVADICTGSGCIACSIAHEHPQTHVIATDISPEAAALARENVEALQLQDRVQVLECDLAEGVEPDLVGSFDLIVSNPPYIPSSELAQLPEEVAGHEPALALDGGADGLDVFRRLLTWCESALKPGGAFAFELHETCLDEAAELARAARFIDVRTVTDLADRPRVLVGRRETRKQ